MTRGGTRHHGTPNQHSPWMKCKYYSTSTSQSLKRPIAPDVLTTTLSGSGRQAERDAVTRRRRSAGNGVGENARPTHPPETFKAQSAFATGVSAVGIMTRIGCAPSHLT